MAEAPALVSPRDIVRSGLCIGCGSCVAGVADARMAWDGYGQLKPKGPNSWYSARTPAFSRRCPFSPAARNEDAIAHDRFPDVSAADPLLGRFEHAYVGHAAEGFREPGSSGGLVSWVAAELLRRGLVDAVAHVAAVHDPNTGGPYFRYRLSRTDAEVRSGAKSRYHPIELSDVLSAIRATPGRYAIVGVPCFIKAVHLAREAEPVLAERITHLLGLFCGHMKSARLVESFAWQTGAPVPAIRAVDYRRKDPNRPANWYRASLSLVDGQVSEQDWMHLADGDWGAGFFQNSACNFCDDVVAETADIAFGDAWVEPYASDGRGTNVAIVRSRELYEIVEAARNAGRLALEPVDAAFVVGTQAAGFRHRREGLAYRLTWDRRGIRPPKRVSPGAHGLPWRRRLVYRARWWIARLSHPTFALARRTGWHGLYLRWAKGCLAAYQGLAWGHGRFGRWLDKREGRTREG